MDWAGATYGVDFLKKCVLFGRSIFQKKHFFHDRGRRGRSRRENSGKILAAAFSRRDFLMVLGVVGGLGGRGGGSGRDPGKLFF